MPSLRILVKTLAISMALSGVATAAEQVERAAIGTPFELALNQPALVGDTGVTVRFEAVASDSRCPVEVDCIWAGVAKVTLVVSREGNAPTEVTVDTLGATGQAEGLTFTLVKLDPPASVNVPSPDYVGTFQVDLLSP